MYGSKYRRSRSAWSSIFLPGFVGRVATSSEMDWWKFGIGNGYFGCVVNSTFCMEIQTRSLASSLKRNSLRPSRVASRPD